MISQLLVNLLLAVVDRIKQDPICKSCEILERELEFHRTERVRLQEIILRNTGLINALVQEDAVSHSLNEDIRVTPRGHSLTSIRAQASMILREKHKKMEATPATMQDLTEAERIFQQELEAN